MTWRTATRQRGVVLLYHRVTEPGADPLGMAVSADRFQDHLAVMREEADIVGLDRIFDATPRRRSVAVTFDDGYADNVEVAAPLMIDADVPATFFVVADDPSVEFWWDRLEHLLEAPTNGTEHLDLNIAGRRLRADVRSAAVRAQARRALNHRIRELHPDAIPAVLGDVAEQMGRAAPACARHRRAAVHELRTLVNAPGMCVGSHTRHHALLGRLPEREQARELADARAWLEGVVDGGVDLLAYPFGMPGSWDRGTERLAQDVGYRLACTNVVGIVQRRTPRYRLPRCQVGDWSADELRDRLRRWFAGER